MHKEGVTKTRHCFAKTYFARGDRLAGAQETSHILSVAVLRRSGEARDHDQREADDERREHQRQKRRRAGVLNSFQMNTPHSAATSVAPCPSP